mmetsp:Transcript_2952/g.6328  ORF Transcript_2952/g.6328 Transcript_2952/m.6328 type:complete len:344 (+) Transcript_2952:409-1440(+)
MFDVPFTRKDFTRSRGTYRGNGSSFDRRDTKNPSVQLYNFVRRQKRSISFFAFAARACIFRALYYSSRGTQRTPPITLSKRRPRSISFGCCFRSRAVLCVRTIFTDLVVIVIDALCTGMIRCRIVFSGRWSNVYLISSGISIETVSFLAIQGFVILVFQWNVIPYTTAYSYSYSGIFCDTAFLHDQGGGFWNGVVTFLPGSRIGAVAGAVAVAVIFWIDCHTPCRHRGRYFYSRHVRAHGSAYGTAFQAHASIRVGVESPDGRFHNGAIDQPDEAFPTGANPVNTRVCNGRRPTLQCCPTETHQGRSQGCLQVRTIQIDACLLDRPATKSDAAGDGTIFDSCV